ncbi:hypothetical protein [Paenibacillus konkukensis]|uniref:hypothetical protein n=1 Tax=Paenibacillus konkukensis TaxID=2020716 RepID=UPI00201E0232|nr:hypothetical protein [Paenibacillus konkukensis]
MQLLDATAQDNFMFLSTAFLAMYDLLSRAVRLYIHEQPASRSAIQLMTDQELLALLQSGARTSPPLARLLQLLLSEPHRIEPCGEHSPGAFPLSVRKVTASSRCCAAYRSASRMPRPRKR